MCGVDDNHDKLQVKHLRNSNKTTFKNSEKMYASHTQETWI